MKLVLNLDKKLSFTLLITICLLLIGTWAFATGYTAGIPSHSTLFVDTLQGKTGGAVNVNDNLGVGVAAPTQKLDVAGNVKGTGLCIGSDCRTSWPASGSSGSTSCTEIGAITVPTNGQISTTIAVPGCMNNIAGCKIVMTELDNYYQTPRYPAEMRFSKNPSNGAWAVAGWSVTLQGTMTIGTSGGTFGDGITQQIVRGNACWLTDDGNGAGYLMLNGYGGTTGMGVYSYCKVHVCP